MNREDIEQAVADLVEAMAIDMAILEAQSGMSSYGAMRADARRAYETAAELYGTAEAQYLELQRHKRDVSALRERLSSLLAGGNISTGPNVSGGVKQHQRVAYAVHAHGVQYLRPSSDAVREDIEDILAGNQDDAIREWMQET